MNDNHQGGTGPGAATRRSLLRSAGAIGASAVLAACGSDDSTSGATTGTAPTGGASPGPAGALSSTSDIPVGGGKIFDKQGVVVTQPKAGEFKGFSNICTHQGCPVASVQGGTINCNCHGSRFSIEDGSVKHPPATRPLPPKAIKVEGDKIVLA
ncbi:Rieske (2Fe-2S) protein [Micromonospora cremea]|uniref:Cytochrome bc1 complex Rieske iron-sulfur subunit n=1 Tax=Micromonospora cremea TaxID=709881 RepID=A0A1N6BDY6_9ACTN|nr:Rieske (2Fe-2S) protein [Micromonospora cremea]SIN44405.1 Ferredoxin subunit of nitrite reductase or a ring-hydroxylating dioxygenase [Micromonospora cremea]